MTEHTYAAAGVSLEAAEAVVGRLRDAVASTRTTGVLDAHGGFASLVASPGADELLVSATDGVGTKLVLLSEAGRLHDAGIDCVAMVVNDVVCTGARPLFFLDYVAVGRLDPDRVATLVEGIADGCRQAGCALVGGETAEHPGVMGERDLDVAGFCVGSVARDRLIDGSRVEAGDAVLGIASTGPHANGFSLVRRLLASEGLGVADAPGDLLAPTAIYALDVAALQAAVDVRALAHVTGGGIEGNVPRVLPRGLGVEIDPDTWDRPPLWNWLAGFVAEAELRRAFNAGVGMVAIVPETQTSEALALLAERHRRAWRIGRVVRGAGVAYTR
jgi:phosphoribosylformylglycinamidine cyclo-ligase